MDPLGILNGIKGQVLNAANFEKLKRAYDLLNENLAQLAQSNSALKEHSEIMKAANDRLKTENAHLMDEVARLTRICEVATDEDLSDAAQSVLRLCAKRDMIEFYDDQLSAILKLSRIQVSAALDDLHRANLIKISAGQSMGMGTLYYLTDHGKREALRLA